MTVLNNQKTAKYVPAAEGKRSAQAMSGITGVKGIVDGSAGLM